MLFKGRVTLECRQVAQLFHPADALGGLDLRLRGNQVGIVERRGLHVDLAGENLFVGIEEAGAAIAARKRRAFASP